MCVCVYVCVCVCVSSVRVICDITVISVKKRRKKWSSSTGGEGVKVRAVPLNVKKNLGDIVMLMMSCDVVVLKTHSDKL